MKKKTQSTKTPDAPVIKLRNGTVIPIPKFPIKESNFRKVNLHRNGGDVEGVWASFSDEDLPKYSDDTVSGEVAVVILVNSALHLYPHNSWGLYVPVTFKGASRPECNLNTLAGDMIFCLERVEAEADEKKKTEQKGA